MYSHLIIPESPVHSRGAKKALLHCSNDLPYFHFYSLPLPSETESNIPPLITIPQATNPTACLYSLHNRLMPLVNLPASFLPPLAVLLLVSSLS